MEDVLCSYYIYLLECDLKKKKKLILSGSISQFNLSFKCLCQLQHFQLLIQELAEVNRKANFQTLDTKVGLLIFSVCWMGTTYLIIGHNSEAKHV